MLDRIYGELAKLIARDIYEGAKKTPALLSSLRGTGLKASGSEPPEAVLKEFDHSFTRAMDSLVTDGSGKWRDGKSETLFRFRLISGLLGQVRGV